MDNYFVQRRWESKVTGIFSHGSVGEKLPENLQRAMSCKFKAQYIVLFLT